MVWKLDRLARSLRQLVEPLEGLSVRQVGFRSLTESLDAEIAGGRLFFHIFVVLAEFERSAIRERVRTGLQSARRNGKALRGFRGKLGAARALLKESGLSKRAAALQLGISAPTLYQSLKA